MKKGETVRFPLPAPTSSQSWDFCDKEGNAYLVYGSIKPQPGPGPIVPPTNVYRPITKLSLDSQTTTEYAPQSIEGYQSFYRAEFSVDRQGDVYGLFVARRSSADAGTDSRERYVVVEFHDDGSVDSAVTLRDPPSGVLVPSHFIAFADGNLLVTGTIHPPRPRPGQGPPYAGGVRITHHTPPGLRPFTGIFDRHGRFVQEVKLPGDVSPSSGAPASAGSGTPGAPGGADKAQHGAREGEKASPVTPPEMRWVNAIMETLAIGGPENTVYLLRASSPPMLYSISSDGQVVHTVRVRTHLAGKVIPTNMSLAGRSSLLVDFYGTSVDKKGNWHVTWTYALVDPRTGNVTAAYRLPKDARVAPLCAVGPNDFLFIGSTRDGKLKVERYSGN